MEKAIFWNALRMKTIVVSRNESHYTYAITAAVCNPRKGGRAMAFGKGVLGFIVVLAFLLAFSVA
jgi:hypothetical protein